MILLYLFDIILQKENQERKKVTNKTKVNLKNKIFQQRMHINIYKYISYII